MFRKDLINNKVVNLVPDGNDGQTLNVKLSVTLINISLIQSLAVKYISFTR